MRHVTKPIVVGFAAALIAGTAFADDMKNPAVQAREAVMDVLAFNLGQLGAMAKEQMPYDADAASKAAGNIVLLTQLDQTAMWPEGTDNATNSDTRALPAIWANHDDFMAKLGKLNEAAVAMQGAAGTDLASLQGAMGDLGGACGACHKAYRAPDN